MMTRLIRRALLALAASYLSREAKREAIANRADVRAKARAMRKAFGLPESEALRG